MMKMMNKEVFHVAYMMYYYDIARQYNTLPMTEWGFENVVQEKTRDSYIQKAIFKIRRKKILEIKENIYGKR
jgi:hypothetical protein